MVRLGPVAAGRLVPVMLALPFLSIASGVVIGWLPAPALAFLGAGIPAIRASRIALEQPADGRRMTAAFGQVMLTLLSGGALLAGGLVLAGVLA